MLHPLILARAHGVGRWIAGEHEELFQRHAEGLEISRPGIGAWFQEAAPRRAPHTPYWIVGHEGERAQVCFHDDHRVVKLVNQYSEDHCIGPGRTLHYVHSHARGLTYHILFDETMPELDPKVYPSALAALMESEHPLVREYVLTHLLPTVVLADEDASVPVLA